MKLTTNKVLSFETMTNLLSFFYYDIYQTWL